MLKFVKKIWKLILKSESDEGELKSFDIWRTDFRVEGTTCTPTRSVCVATETYGTSFKDAVKRWYKEAKKNGQKLGTLVCNDDGRLYLCGFQLFDNEFDATAKVKRMKVLENVMLYG